MDEARWLRPGPAMLVVAAGFGLLAGSALGLTVSDGRPADRSAGPSSSATVAPPTTQPGRFWLVQVAAFRYPAGKSEAEAKVATLVAKGFNRAGVLVSEDYAPALQPGYYVVFGAQFPFDQQGRQQANELAASLNRAGFPGAYRRPVDHT